MNLLSAYFTIGTFNLTIVDVVAVAVLLVFLIIGIVKGFANQILSILGWVAAVVVSILLVDTVVKLVYDGIPDVVTWFKGFWEEFKRFINI